MSSWVEPKTNWDENYEPSPQDMNRMERNTHALRHQDIDFDGDKTFNGTVDFPGGVEGPLNVDGNLEIDGTLSVTGAASADTLSVTGAASADSLNTGQGANNLHPMNQGVRTTDNVTHNNITAAGTLTPRAAFANGSQTLASQQTMIVPRGVYWMRGESEPEGVIRIEVLIDGVWSTVASLAPMIVFSDGVNVRMHNTNFESSMTMHWLRI